MSKPQCSSPHVCILINFNEQEFKAVEYYARKATDYGVASLDRADDEDFCGLSFHNVTNDNYSSRVNMFTKGGVFLMSHKVLLLDLVGKRFDPKLLSCLVIN